MYKKLMLLTAMLALCIAATAQRKAIANPWVKPVPTASSLADGGKYYLYNVAAQGFYTGANDWETRASFNAKKGYLAEFVKALKSDNTWDGKSYSIQYTIETGGDKGKQGTVKILGYDNVWIDELLDGPDDKYLSFTAQTDGTYRIGLSPLNTNYADEGVYLGLRKDQYNDTRLYFVDTEVDDMTGYESNLAWLLVSETDFDSYDYDLLTYRIATKLHEALEYAETVFPSMDITEEKTTFSNTSSDATDLIAAFDHLVNKMMNAADAEHPADLTTRLIAEGMNFDYTDIDDEEWLGTAPAVQACRGAEFFNTNYDAHHYFPSQLGEGFYRITLDGFYRAGYANDDAAEWEKLLNGEEAAQNAMLYVTTKAGTSTAPLPLIHDGVTSETLGDDRVETAYGYVPNNMWTASKYFEEGLYKNPASVIVYAENDEEFNFGVKKDVQRDGDWTFLYGWHTEYLGNSNELAMMLRDQHLAAYPDYVEMVENNTLEYYTRSLYQTYAEAYNALKEATIKEEVLEAIPTFEAQAALMQANVDAWAAYYAKYTETEDFVTEHQTDLMGEGYNLLADYVWDEQEPGTYPNGSGPFILNEGILSTEQITAEINYVQKLKDDALTGGMYDGMDVTDLIKNPHFATTEGWTKEGLPEYPVGSGDYKLGQAFSILFGVSQQITGLQNGLYELSLNDLFRPANYGSADYGNDPKAYVFMNGFQKKLNTIESGATEGTENGHSTLIAGVGYVPNTVDEAAASFQAGNYQQKLYGLVTDGVMTLGLRNDLRYEGCWAAWSDLHLTFRAKNPEVLAEVIASTLPVAANMLTNKCGSEEIGALYFARTAAENAEGEDRYDAMVTLKNAMDAVEECTATYVTLKQGIDNLRQAIADNPTASKVDEANALLSEVETNYEADKYNNAEALAKIDEVGAMVVAVKLGDSGEGDEQDYSDLIVNRTFDPTKGSKDAGTIEGWTTTAMNGYKEYTVSYNRAGFELYQDLTGLPKGHYKVTVHTYYRAGYWNEEEERINNGEETHLTTLYAQTSNGKAETPVLNLTEGATSEKYHDSKFYTLSSGLYAPDGTTGTAAWFAAGAYLNELEFDVPADGKVRIGLSKTDTFANDYEVVGEWNLYYYGDTEEDVHEDYTSLIVNPTFDPTKGSKESGTIEGWTTTAMNGYKEYTVSYNRAGFHLYQDLTGLPYGNYEVTVHTYYRAGYWNEEEERINNGEETHLTTLYTETSAGRTEKPVLNLTEGATSEKYDDSKFYTLSNGLFAPDGTTGTAAWFAADQYLNSLYFYVPKDGKARIGLIKTETYANDYEVVGAWNLYFLGTSTGIDDVEKGGTERAAAVEFYTLSGMRLDRPQRGINIVRMSDGTTRKVLLK